MNNSAYVTWINGIVELDYGSREDALQYFQQSIENDQSDPARWLNFISLIDESSVRMHLYRILKETFPQHRPLIEQWIEDDLNDIAIEDRWEEQYELTRERSLLEKTWQLSQRLASNTWDVWVAYGWRNVPIALDLLQAYPLRWTKQLAMLPIQRYQTRTQVNQMERRLDSMLHTHTDLFPDYIPRATQLLSANLMQQLVMLKALEPTRTRLYNYLSELMQPGIALAREQTIVEQLSNQIQLSSDILISKAERNRLSEAIRNEVVGLGLLQTLLDDETITEISVFSPTDIRYKRRGRVNNFPDTFDDDAQVLKIANRLIAPLGIRYDEMNPVINVRLNDLTIHGVTHPVSASTVLNIRKDSYLQLGIQDLIRFGSMTVEIAEFLRASVIAGLNILFVGSSGVGVTTLMSVLTAFMPNDETVCVIESRPKLFTQHATTVYLYTLSPDGKKVSTTSDLMETADSLRSGFLLIADHEKSETEGILRRISERKGVLFEQTARTTTDALITLEQDIYNANPGIGEAATRALIVNGIDIVVEQQRLRDGSRKATRISELEYERGGIIRVNPIFEFEQTGFEYGKIIGRIRPTGYRPMALDPIFDAGINLPPSLFGVGHRSEKSAYQHVEEFTYTPMPLDPFPLDSWAFKTEDENRVAPVFTPYGLLVSSYDNNLWMVDHWDGHLLWRFRTGDGVATVPAYDDASKLCFFGSDDRSFYAVHAETGLREWTYTTRGAIRGSPTVGHGHVVFGSDDGNLYTVNLRTGRLLWLWDGVDYIRSKVLLTDNAILFGNQSGEVRCVSLDGKPIWTLQTNSSITNHVLDDIEDMVYITSLNGDVIAVDLSRGYRLWRLTDAHAIISTPILHGESLMIVATTNGKVRAIDRQSGVILWTQKFEQGFVSNPQLLDYKIDVTDDEISQSDFLSSLPQSHADIQVIVVGDLTGALHFIQPKTGQILGKFQLSGPIMGLATDTRRLAVTTLDHYVYSFKQNQLIETYAPAVLM